MCWGLVEKHQRLIYYYFQKWPENSRGTVFESQLVWRLRWISSIVILMQIHHVYFNNSFFFFFFFFCYFSLCQTSCCCCCQVTSVVSDSVRPHRQQGTRLLCPWDSPGMNTGAGCRFLLQCMKVKSENEVAQSFPTLRDPMDCSLPGFSVHGIFQARVPEWVAIAFTVRQGLQTISFLNTHAFNF